MELKNESKQPAASKPSTQVPNANLAIPGPSNIDTVVVHKDHLKSSTTLELVHEAIKVLGMPRKGASLIAIKKWMLDHKDADRPDAKILVQMKKAILKGLENGTIIRAPGTKQSKGVTGSFLVVQKPVKEARKVPKPVLKKKIPSETQDAIDHPKVKKSTKKIEEEQPKLKNAAKIDKKASDKVNVKDQPNTKKSSKKVDGEDQLQTKKASKKVDEEDQPQAKKASKKVDGEDQPKIKKETKKVDGEDQPKIKKATKKVDGEDQPKIKKATKKVDEEDQPKIKKATTKVDEEDQPRIKKATKKINKPKVQVEKKSTMAPSDNVQEKIADEIATEISETNKLAAPKSRKAEETKTAESNSGISSEKGDEVAKSTATSQQQLFLDSEPVPSKVRRKKLQKLELSDSELHTPIKNIHKLKSASDTEAELSKRDSFLPKRKLQKATNKRINTRKNAPK